MAVGKTEFPAMPVIAGVRLGTAMAGIKKPDRRDLVVIEVAEGSRVAGSFTLNAFCAAPVVVAKQNLAACGAHDAGVRLLVINTCNVNAGTGKAGLRDARATCAELARLPGRNDDSVLAVKTRVLGLQRPVELVPAGRPLGVASVGNDSKEWHYAGAHLQPNHTRPNGGSVNPTMRKRPVTVHGL